MTLEDSEASNVFQSHVLVAFVGGTLLLGSLTHCPLLARQVLGLGSAIWRFTSHLVIFPPRKTLLNIRSGKLVYIRSRSRPFI